MKATPEQVDRLRALVAPLDTFERRNAYRAGDFPRADAVRDLDKRYRWDLVHAAGGTRTVVEMYDEGLTDVHLDTVLRSIVPAL